MGFSRKRIGRDGKPRYTAYYLDIRGQERSAGTFSSKKDANDAGKKAEGAVSAGKPGDPSRGRQTFKVYVLEKWLPHHLLEPGVRSNYAGHIRNHLLPFFGPMKMRDIMPEHVRQWVTYMKDKGASAQTIRYSKGSVLNAIFTTALTDGVVTIHPSHGVKTPATPSKPRRIITPAQFDHLYQALPSLAPGAGGDRHRKRTSLGELTEMRVRDLDFETRILTVSPRPNSQDCPDGERFLVKDYPKTRNISASSSASRSLQAQAHVITTARGDNDLFFTTSRRHCTGQDAPTSAPLPAVTEPMKGRQYRHGTTAWPARCRCGIAAAPMPPTAPSVQAGR